MADSVRTYRDRFNRANGAPGSMPNGKSALVVLVGGGTHENTVAATNGWTVTTIDTLNGGVWPARATIAQYDLLVIDAGYNGIDATGQTNASNAYADGVSVYTTGNDTTAMLPLFTGVVSDDGTNNDVAPAAINHTLAAGWATFGDGDNGLYLSGVNPSAITFATGTSGGVSTRPLGVAMENALNGARWVHLQPWAGTHPAGVDAAIYGWLAGRWQTAKTWEAVSGAATISNNELLFSTAGSSNPIYAVDLGKRFNGSCDVDCSVTPRHVYGNALYVRVVDASNWVRLRLQSYYTTYSYYNTEYEYNDVRWYDYYAGQQLQYEWVSTTTTYSAWSAWATYGLTSCVHNTSEASLPADTDTTQYRFANQKQGNCAAGTYRWDKQSRTRSVTGQTNTYQWSASSPGAGWSQTGNTRYANDGSFTSVWSLSTSDTNPGTQTTTAPSGPSDHYQWTAAYSGTYTTYWSTSSVAPDYNGYGPGDTATGNTRQAGPYTGYNYYYGQLILEKCVAGSITTLGSYSSNDSTPKVMRLVAKGSSLTTYYDGTQRITATDATHATTGTKTGIGGCTSDYNPTVARLDDFSVTLITPLKVRNAADTAWIDVPYPKVRVGSSWVEVDPRRY